MVLYIYIFTFATSVTKFCFCWSLYTTSTQSLCPWIICQYRDALLSGDLHSYDLEQNGPSTTTSNCSQSIEEEQASCVSIYKTLYVRGLIFSGWMQSQRYHWSPQLSPSLRDSVVAAHLGCNGGHLYKSKREQWSREGCNATHLKYSVENGKVRLYACLWWWICSIGLKWIGLSSYCLSMLCRKPLERAPTEGATMSHDHWGECACRERRGKEEQSVRHVPSLSVLPLFLSHTLSLTHSLTHSDAFFFFSIEAMRRKQVWSLLETNTGIDMLAFNSPLLGKRLGLYLRRCMVFPPQFCHTEVAIIWFKPPAEWCCFKVFQMYFQSTCCCLYCCLASLYSRKSAGLMFNVWGAVLHHINLEVLWWILLTKRVPHWFAHQPCQEHS